MHQYGDCPWSRPFKIISEAAAPTTAARRLNASDYAPVLLGSPRVYFLPTQKPAEHLRTLGFLPAKASLSPSEVPIYTLKKHQYSNILAPFEKQLGYTDKYAGTIGSIGNVSVNIAKLDVVPVYEFRENPCYRKALNFVAFANQSAFDADTVPIEVIRAATNQRAVCGYPESLFWKTKGDAMNDPHFWECYYDPSCDAYPFFKYAPKVEWKELAEILNNKIRGFAVGSIRMVLKQREYFGSISDKIKMLGWSAYGFNPFTGGTTRLVERMGWLRRWIRWDTSGWDRKFALMREVLELWRSKLRVPVEKQEEFDRLFGRGSYYALEKFFYIMPDGNVVPMSFSGPSGHGLTTEFNITGHQFVFAMFILEHIPTITFEELLSLPVAIYGDDIWIAIPEPGEPYHAEMNALFPEPLSEDDDETAGSIYRPWLLKNFGWEAKFFFSDRAPHKRGVVFLGFNPVPSDQDERVFLPQWSKERLMAPFFRTIDGKSDPAQLNTLYNLLVMSYPNPDVYEVFRSAYLEVLNAHKASKHPEIVAAVRRGAPTPLQLFQFYSGFESGITLFDEEWLEIFSLRHGWLEVEKRGVSKLQARLTNKMSNVGKTKEQKPGGPKTNHGTQDEGYQALIARTRDLVAQGKTLIGKPEGDGSHVCSPGHQAHAARVQQLSRTLKSGVQASRKGAEKQGQEGGRTGGPQVAKGGVQHPIGVGADSNRRNSFDNGGRTLTPVLPPKSLEQVSSRVNLFKTRTATVIPTGGGEPTTKDVRTLVSSIPRVYGGPPLKLNSPFQKLTVGGHSFRPGLQTDGVSFANGTTYTGVQAKEREWVDKKGRHVQIVGSQYLRENLISSDRVLGDRIDRGTIPLSPQALGGRLAQLADEFSMHRVNQLRVIYSSTCAASTDGGTFVYSLDDIATATLNRGLTELMEASLRKPNFASFNVWRDCAVELDPTNMNARYVDESTGEAYFMFQGLIEIGCASAFTLGDSGSFGNFYLEYDVTFDGPILDYEIEEVSDFDCTFSWDHSDTNQSGIIIPIKWGPVIAGDQPNLFGSVVTPPSSTRYVATGTVTGVTGDPIHFATLSDNELRTMAVGQNFYLSFSEDFDVAGTNDWTDYSIQSYLYVDLQSAIDNNYTGGGVVVWSGSNNTGGTAHTGTFTLSGALVPLSDKVSPS